MIGWAPFEWALPIQRQELRYILPIELPEGVVEAEQVTDGIVDATGLLTSDLSSFDRWVYFATPDEESGKSYLSIFVRKDDLAPQTEFVPTFFLPGGTITVTKETPIPLNTLAPTPTPAGFGGLSGDWLGAL